MFYFSAPQIPQCRADLAGDEGQFASPNFPQEYPEKSNCTWNINVSEGHKIRIIFHLVTVRIFFTIEREGRISKIGDLKLGPRCGDCHVKLVKLNLEMCLR